MLHHGRKYHQQQQQGPGACFFLRIRPLGMQTVASMRRFTAAALVAPTQGLPKRRLSAVSIEKPGTPQDTVLL